MLSNINKKDVTIIIPTLNEEDAIGEVIMELKREGFNNILIVDGYSTDNTAKIAQSNGGSVVFQHSIGKAGALETAVEHVKTPFMVVMDGDYTYDPKDIEKLMSHIKNYDQVIGVRVNGRKNIPILNRLGNWLITKTFNLLMGTKLSDVCSGMYALKTEIVRQLEFRSKGFDIEVEIAAQIATEGKLTEVPIDYRKRVGGQKLSALRHGFQILTSILNLARRYNPALLFSIVAALVAVPAFLILTYAIFEVLLYGVWHSGYALTGILLLLLASQLFTVGIISVLLKRMERRITQKLLGSS